MVQAYNFLASWQLFPEKCTYGKGERPKSGICKIEAPEDRRELLISRSWVTLENTAFASELRVNASGGRQPFTEPAIADESVLVFNDSISFELDLFSAGEKVLGIHHEIMPNGYLKITESVSRQGEDPFVNTEIYHKQFSVLPYSSSVSGAVIRPTEEGVIRHKALTAMEEQTNMQLTQIRQQIELLALQAQEIQKRKDLSMMIYDAKLSFQPNIGQVYYLYEKKDNNLMLSLVSPKEWGAGSPFKRFIAGVKLLADHTWMELS